MSACRFTNNQFASRAVARFTNKAPPLMHMTKVSWLHAAARSFTKTACWSTPSIPVACTATPSPTDPNTTLTARIANSCASVTLEVSQQVSLYQFTPLTPYSFTLFYYPLCASPQVNIQFCLCSAILCFSLRCSVVYTLTRTLSQLFPLHSITLYAGNTQTISLLSAKTHSFHYTPCSNPKHVISLNESKSEYFLPEAHCS